MKRIMLAVLALILEGTAFAAVPPPAVKAERQQAREALQAGKKRLKLVGAERHKELVLVRERERSDLRLAKASAARGEALHARILEIHEKSRRDRLALRSKEIEERDRWRRAVKAERDKLIALRQKK